MTRRTRWRTLEVPKRFHFRDIFVFVMYYVYGVSGPSLLIESTESTIMDTYPNQKYIACCSMCLSLVVEIMQSVKGADVAGSLMLNLSSLYPSISVARLSLWLTLNLQTLWCTAFSNQPQAFIGTHSL